MKVLLILSTYLISSFSYANSLRHEDLKNQADQGNVSKVVELLAENEYYQDATYFLAAYATNYLQMKKAYRASFFLRNDFYKNITMSLGEDLVPATCYSDNSNTTKIDALFSLSVDGDVPGGYKVSIESEDNFLNESEDIFLNMPKPIKLKIRSTDKLWDVGLYKGQGIPVNKGLIIEGSRGWKLFSPVVYPDVFDGTPLTHQYASMEVKYNLGQILLKIKTSYGYYQKIPKDYWKLRFEDKTIPKFHKTTTYCLIDSGIEMGDSPRYFF